MRLLSALIAVGVSLPVWAFGPSNRTDAGEPAYPFRPQCLETDGPVVRVEGYQGERPFELLSWEPGTVIDARGARWDAHWAPPAGARNCYPVVLGMNWVAVRLTG